MLKEILIRDKIVIYDLQYKNVKNINLRIKADGSVHVSANKRISEKAIEAFLLSKSDFIHNALEKFSHRVQTEPVRYYSDEEIRDVILGLCEKSYPYFESRGVKNPVTKFRKMISQWGNCRREKGILTFSLNLVYAPLDCIEYVVLHEFTHFLQPNHSASFYAELEKVCPDWRSLKRKLKNISIR